MKRLLVLLFVCIAPISCSKSSPAAPGPTVTSLTITGNTTVNDVNRTSQLAAIAGFSNGQTQDQTLAATWTSSNAAVATVSATGLLTGVSLGTATITATFQGVTGTRTVTATRVCAEENTGTASFRNGSTGTRQRVEWDGVAIFQLQPGETGGPITTAAGSHSLQVRDVDNRGGGCVTTVPVTVMQCALNTFTCPR